MHYYNSPHRMVASPPPSLPSYEDFNVSKSFVVHHPRSRFSGFDANAGYPTSLFSSRFGPGGSWHLSLIAHPFLTAAGLSLEEEGRLEDAEYLDLDQRSPALDPPAFDPFDPPSPRSSDCGDMEMKHGEQPDLDHFLTPRQNPTDIDAVNIQEPQEAVLRRRDDTFYIEAVFNSDNEIHGSVSFEFATMAGSILKHDSSTMIGGDTHTVRLSENEAGTDLDHILFTIRVVSSSRPSGFPLYDPVQVTSLLMKMLEGKNVQDVKYVLYRRAPAGEPKKNDLGCVFANKEFLSSKCDYFKTAFTSDTQHKEPQDDIGIKEPQDDASTQEHQDDTSAQEPQDGPPEGNPNPEDEDDLPQQPQTAPFESNYDNDPPQQSQIAPFEFDYDIDSDSDLEEGDEDDIMDHDAEDKESAPKDATVVNVPDAAYNTWKAVIFYLYTGNIRFGHLRSTSAGKLEALKDSKGGDYKGLKPVSCKSVFRLAEKLQMPELEHLALLHLKSQLSIVNIWTEILSPFTARFEKIRKLEMDFLIDNWNIVRASGQVEEYLEVMSQGKIPHARSIFGELFKRLKPEPSSPVDGEDTQSPNCY